MKNKVILTVVVLLGLVVVAKVLLPGGQQGDAPEGYGELASDILGLLGDLEGAESGEGGDERVMEPFELDPENEGLGDVY